MRARRLNVMILSIVTLAGTTRAAPPRELDRDEYKDRLHGMFLAECMANWTGIKTEGRRQAPPFHTDADWGTAPYPDSPWITLDYVLLADPWFADDDTDIEYVYLHLLTQHAPRTRLTPEMIRDGWMLHCNHDIWVSNAMARYLMDLGARPPSTAFAQGMVGPSYADLSMMIDAQLTTEIFGALAPGMPEIALELADLPVRTTACGYAAHASQFYIVLYSLATQVDRSLPAAAQVEWLTHEARKFVPDTSKSADIIDFVLTDYLANPDKNNWELTRDRVYERYVLRAAENGFRYRAWYESSVNLATGVMALLYGELDLAKTVRIGTLSGWDSDNGTATMGGLLGLMLGMQGVRTQFAQWQSVAPSDRYWAARTRDNLPDHLPGDSAADDTLTMMAERCMPIIDRVVEEAGGRVGPETWLLAPGGAGAGLSHAAALALSPTEAETRRSVNVWLPLSGGSVTAESNVPGSPGAGYGSWYIPLIVNGLEHDFRGLEPLPGYRDQYSTQRPLPAVTPALHVLATNYSRPVEVHTIRFVEGNHYHAPSDATPGGWFENITVEARVNGVWTTPAVTLSEPLDSGVPFQILDFQLSEPVMATAIRVSGQAGGGVPGRAFVTCADLDALTAPIPSVRRSFDTNRDGRADVEDLYRWYEVPEDLNADGMSDDDDARTLRRAVRWTESMWQRP